MKVSREFNVLKDVEWLKTNIYWTTAIGQLLLHYGMVYGFYLMFSLQMRIFTIFWGEYWNRTCECIEMWQFNPRYWCLHCWRARNCDRSSSIFLASKLQGDTWTEYFLDILSNRFWTVSYSLLGENSSASSQVYRHRSWSNQREARIFLLLLRLLLSAEASRLSERMGSSWRQWSQQRQGHHVSAQVRNRSLACFAAVLLILEFSDTTRRSGLFSVLASRRLFHAFFGEKHFMSLFGQTYSATV